MKVRLAICAALGFPAVFGVATVAQADTRAPGAQHVMMTCDSGTYDVLSPAEAAHGGQVTTSTATNVALNTTVTDATTGEILFQSRPTAVRNPQAQTCWFAIDGVIVTIGAIVTPRG
jgi:hypothetical protein